VAESTDFDQILIATQRQIRSYIAGMGVPMGDIDDVAQDVYIEYYRHQAQLPANVQPIGWLKGIARNLSLNYFRRQGRTARFLAELCESLSSEASFLDVAGADERALSILRDCVSKLDPADRQLLEWYYVEETTADVIGGRLGRPASSVRVTLMRLRDSLRACMQQALAKA
jgi:RNA polymerase sigma-70 factor, ECF subfamily